MEKIARLTENRANGQRTIEQYAAAAAEAPQNVEPTSVQGGSLVEAGSDSNDGESGSDSGSSNGGSGTGSAAQPTRTAGSDATGALGRLSLSMLGLTVAAVAVAGAAL